MGRVLPERSVQGGVQRGRQPPVAAHLPMGAARAPEQAEALGDGRYFGKFNSSRQDRWVFGDRDSGAYLVRFVWTKIVRHQIVTGTSSPDDPALTGYWDQRH